MSRHLKCDISSKPPWQKNALFFDFYWCQLIWLLVLKIQQSRDAVINQYIFSGASLAWISATDHISKLRSQRECRPPPQNYSKDTDKEDASIATLSPLGRIALDGFHSYYQNIFVSLCLLFKICWIFVFFWSLSEMILINWVLLVLKYLFQSYFICICKCKNDSTLFH